MPEYYTHDHNDLRLPDDPEPRGVDKCIPRFHIVEGLRDNKIVQVEMVEIITPGDRLSRPIQKVRDEHRQRWPRQYAAFKAGAEPTVNGTPLQSWKEIDWSMSDQLRACGFQTVEQVAAADDCHIGSVTNGGLLRRKAQLFVESRNRESSKDRELEELRERLAKLEAATPEARRPGRPRKQAEATAA